jgi:hypothetical protein
MGGFSRRSRMSGVNFAAKDAVGNSNFGGAELEEDLERYYFNYTVFFRERVIENIIYLNESGTKFEFLTEELAKQN